MRHIAIIGSGPSGYYAAEALQSKFGDEVLVDIIDKLPVPFGLIRFGVAPDHQSIKNVTRRFEKTALTDNVRFAGNIRVGEDISVAELLDLYDSVVLAVGAPNDRKLGIEGEDLPGVIGSAAFVGWYNGHPDFATVDPELDGENVVVIGNGNVALDVARILSKTDSEFEGSDIVAHARQTLDKAGTRRITILGRRGPQQIAMTPKELGELGQLERACPLVDSGDLPPIESDDALEPGQRKSVALLRGFADTDEAECATKAIAIQFDFFASPLRIEGDGRAERVIVAETALDDDGRAMPTGREYEVPADLVVSCIGYRSPRIAGVPFDEGAGRFANDEGRIADRLYAVGWARRGPTGTIGTNKPDGYRIADAIAEDLPASSDREGRKGLDRTLAQRGVRLVKFSDWKRLDKMEIDRADARYSREKFVAIEDMLGALFG